MRVLVLGEKYAHETLRLVPSMIDGNVCLLSVHYEYFCSEPPYRGQPSL